MKVLPGNVGSVMEGQKDDRVIICGTKCFRTDQNSRVEGMQQISVAQQKGDQLGAVGIFDLDAGLIGGVSDSRLDLRTDLGGAIENSRHSRWTHASDPS
jgi:hypothetical protein